MFAIFPTCNLFWGETGQITHVSPPSKDIAQKTNYPRHAFEKTCVFEIGAKTLSIASLSLVCSSAKYCAPMSCRSAHTVSSTVFSIKPCALSLDACVLRQRTTFQSFQAFSQLSFAAWNRHSLWPSVALWTQTLFYAVN